MNFQFGLLKKLVLFAKLKEEKDLEETEKEWEKEFLVWTEEFNKIVRIGKQLNILLITTVITIVAAGLLIFFTV
jgi:hypothetical protein